MKSYMYTIDSNTLFRIRASLAELTDCAKGHSHCYEMDKVIANAENLFKEFGEL